MEFPQGALPVHQVAVLGRYQRQQFPDSPGRGQGFEAEVVFEVQIFVFGPCGLTKLCGQALVER